MGAGSERCGGGGFGRWERVSGVGAFVGATNWGGAGSFGATAAAGSLAAAAGGRDGGRGGAGRLRLPGGAESGRWRTGGGGGRLRTGPPVALSLAWGDDGGTGAALGVDGVCEGAPLGAFEPLAPLGVPGRLSRGRGGTEGGTDVRPEAGLGGEGFFD